MSLTDRPDTPAAGFFQHARAQTPPRAEKRPVTIEQLGRVRTDEYAWLRDDNWQEVMRNPSVLRDDIRAHLEAENAYTAAVMEPTRELQEELFQEMRGRIKEDDSTVPLPDGPFEYYARYREGGQYPVFARRSLDRKTGAVGAEEILLDGDSEAGGAEYFDIGAVSHSPDHRYLAWSVDRRGSEYYQAFIRDLETGETVASLTEESAGDLVWSNDATTVFWVRRDENNRPSRVCRSAITGGEPELVYEEADPAFFVNIGKSDNDGFILIEAHTHTSSEIRLIDADAPAGEPRLVAAREPGVEYSLIEGPDRLYFLTNDGGAIDFKIVSAPKDAPGKENWRDVTPHRPGVLILDVESYRDFQVRLERENALPRLVIHRYKDGAEHEIAFDEEAYALGVDGGYEFDTETLRFTYESPTTPEETYDYNMASGERVLRKRQDVPSGHNPDDYAVRRIQATAHDGETVPVTVLYRKDTPLDGSAPLLLYGYGSYGITIPAAFRTKPLSLTDRGMIFAVAHIRGGQAKGYQWYLDGKLEKKTNTFRDFISAAEALIGAGYTSRGRIVAMGGSAGGLLVGAVINMAPDLFAGAIAAVPFVDVLTTMSDGELPLTPPEWPEWGNPRDDEAAYDAILAYSPYDQIGVHAYPHVLATAGLTDPRVTYWEPAKWIARLRERRSDDGLTLLKTEMGAGHGGKTGRFDSLRDDALEYAFALAVTGPDAD